MSGRERGWSGVPEGRAAQFRLAAGSLLRRPVRQLAAGSAALGLAAAAVSVALAGPWDSGQRTAERVAAERADQDGPITGGERGGPGSGKAAQPPGATSVLAALGVGTESGQSPGRVPPPTESGVADALAPLLKDPALGPLRAASVVDATTGKQIYGSDQNTPAIPASTIKIATAVAALDALGPDHRIETAVVAGRTSDDSDKSAGPDEIVLVGGGDPTLTARDPKSSHGEAGLRELAEETARALADRGIEKVGLGYDVSRYSGPEQHPIGPNPNLAPVSPLMVDEGRLGSSTSGPADRSTDPARDAAEKFAGLLRDRGVDTEGKPRVRTADAKADRLAAVRSQPLSALVERMITTSDNDIAEALARHTAIATGKPASFEGAGAAVRARLEKLDLPVGGARLADGSGLDRKNKVSAALLARLLVRAAGPQHPELRSVVTGLPVAGFSGTLRTRYASASAGTGMVRAKTGTLTGVNTLAGLVVDAGGRLLAFAFMTTDAASRDGAQAALDRLASAVANCGCR